MYTDLVSLGATLWLESNDTYPTSPSFVSKAVIFFKKPECQKDQACEETSLIN